MEDTTTKKFLISRGYGAGWSTWADGEAAVLMRSYQPLIDALENGETITEEHPAIISLRSEIDALGDYAYFGGMDGLTVITVPADAAVRITEYDGAESYEVRDNVDWF